MKLSTAIRKGCKGKKQIILTYDDHKGGVCVIGAARLGSGRNNDYPSSIFPVLLEQIENEDGVDESLHACLTYQNDILKWSFKEIADWCEYYGY